MQLLKTCSQIAFVFVTPQQQTKAAGLLAAAKREPRSKKFGHHQPRREREKKECFLYFNVIDIDQETFDPKLFLLCVDRWNHTKHFLHKKTCQQLFFASQNSCVPG